MSDIVRCESCCGRKNIMGLGGMMQKCEVCHGVGHVLLKKEAKKEVDGKLDKRSKAYKESIKDKTEKTEILHEELLKEEA